MSWPWRRRSVHASDVLRRAPTMRASRDELPELFGAAIRGSDWGDLRSTVVSMPAGTDARPLFKGLPGDRCPAPHWGYVIKGQIRIIYADREEVLRAGDLYLPATRPHGCRRGGLRIRRVQPAGGVRT